MTNDATGVLRANGWLAAAGTHTGRVRDHNEDVFYVNADAGIFLVVDGVGGQAAGEVAARIAADRIRRRLERQDAPAAVRVREAITLANREILLKAETDSTLRGMACVLTLAILEGRELTIGHVGDTRLYRLDARGISKLTHDHSPVGELEDARQISETEALLDERRNEVYRDVGSEPREPESDDFIELVRTRVDEDSAILICSDGLTDMLPALEVNRIVRLHAGAPDAAVAALIAAANDVGGKDNVTVVIAEGSRFKNASDGGRAFPPPLPESDVPTLPLAEPANAAVGFGPSSGVAPADVGRGTNASARVVQAIEVVIRSRGVALVGGVVLGLLLPAVLASVPETEVTRRMERLITVGSVDPAAFASIGAALGTAQPGDVVEVAAGEYSEAVSLPAGVELRAAKSGKVVLTAPASVRNWTAIDASGAGSTVRGIRIAGTTTAPMTHGILVAADDVTVDDVSFEGSIGLAVDVKGSGARIRSSRFERLTGTAVRLEQQGAMLRQNIFRAVSQQSPPAIEAIGGTTATFDSNVFMHFPHVVDPETRTDELIGRDNFVILAAPRR